MAPDEAAFDDGRVRGISSDPSVLRWPQEGVLPALDLSLFSAPTVRKRRSTGAGGAQPNTMTERRPADDASLLLGNR
jgi:hypothetical protein